MKTYQFYVRPGRPLDEGTVMLMIDEGDPAPSAADIDEAEQLQDAIAAGDPDIELVPWDLRPGIRLVFRKSEHAALMRAA